MWIKHAAFIAAGVTLPCVAGAQTDYFNTDRGRPLFTQDAVAIERYAFELQAAPLRWSRANGSSAWSIEPEVAYGILPRTQLGIGLQVAHADATGDGAETGVGALHVSVLHALNAETLGLPAIAFTGSWLAPVGKLGPPRGYPTLGAAITRTTSLGRLHLNGDYTVGSEVAEDDEVWDTSRAFGLGEVSRWTAGAAVDRAFALRSMLVGAEVVARQPIVAGSTVEWRASAGLRWQLDPRWALDAGVGRSFGDAGEWSITFGAAKSFGLLTFMPTSR